MCFGNISYGGYHNMQEQLVATQTCLDDQGNTHTFRYFLLSEEIRAGTFFCETYGFRIQTLGGDFSECHAVTFSRTRAEQLLALLSRNTVSPSHLSDVITSCL